jgi:selenide, water dikinase
VDTNRDPALLVGLDTPDDAAVYRLSADLALVQTVDFFTPIVDDPHAWGRIAAANSLSDVYAMGATPVTALNLVAWPRHLGFHLLGRVLEGAGTVCEEAGVAIVGGHSVDDPEPKFGLAVTGTVRPEAVVRKTGAAAGSDLVLTKPLGMGIISSALKEGLADPQTVERSVAVMAELNRGACAAMTEVGVNAATDVTGYGLLGHLLEMLESRVSARLHVSEVPVLDGVLELARRGVLPAGSRRNYEAAIGRVDAPELSDAELRVLFDAQTSGGLLIAVGPDKTADLLRSLQERGVEGASRIGGLVEGGGRVLVEQ